MKRRIKVLVMFVTVLFLGIICNTKQTKAATNIVDVTSGEAVQGSVAYKGEDQYYRYEVTTEGYLQINETVTDISETSVPTLTILDENYNTLGKYDGSSSTNRWTDCYSFKVGTVIYIKVSYRIGYGVLVQNYNLTVYETEATNWEKEYNNTIDTASKIDSDVEIQGLIMYDGDVDYYKYEMPDDGYVNLNIEGREDTEVCPEFEVYDENMVQLDHYYSKSKVTTKKYTYKKGEILYLKVYFRSGFGLSREGYKFTFNFVNSKEWENEGNDTASTARTLFNGVTVYGNCCIESDYDYYELNVKADSLVSMNFNKMNASSDKADWYVTIINSSNKEVGYIITEEGAKKTFNLPKGKYYIVVSSYLQKIGTIGIDYALTVSMQNISLSSVKCLSFSSTKTSIKAKWKNKNKNAKYQIIVSDKKQYNKGNYRIILEDGTLTSYKLTYFYSYYSQRKPFMRKRNYYIKVRQYYDDIYGKSHYGSATIKRIKIK